MSVATKEASTVIGGTTGRQIAVGLLAGAAGGMVFGMMMQMMGRMTMVAMLVGSKSVAVGWLVHLGISIFAGALFALLFGRQVGSWSRSLTLGVGYGMAWWVVGALVLMPARLGMPNFKLTTMAWQSLVGHMMFGMVLAVVSTLAARRVARAS